MRTTNDRELDKYRQEKDVNDPEEFLKWKKYSFLLGNGRCKTPRECIGKTKSSSLFENLDFDWNSIDFYRTKVNVVRTCCFMTNVDLKFERVSSGIIPENFNTRRIDQKNQRLNVF